MPLGVCWSMSPINLDAPAILIWLPDGVIPSDKDFDVHQSWMLTQAIEQAYEASKDHSKRPWIKTNGRILGATEIIQTMYGLRALRLAR